MRQGMRQRGSETLARPRDHTARTDHFPGAVEGCGAVESGAAALPLEKGREKRDRRQPSFSAQNAQVTPAAMEAERNCRNYQEISRRRKQRGRGLRENCTSCSLAPALLATTYGHVQGRQRAYRPASLASQSCFALLIISHLAPSLLSAPLSSRCN